VTGIEIGRMLKDQGFLIEKRNILMEEPIKTLGVFNVPIKLHPEVIANLKLWVVKKQE
jgi:large subunit ribosomal protein L9